MRVLYTGGTFDLFHAGHVDLLRQCKRLADEVVVSLNTDEFVESYKGNPPVMSFSERKRILESCRYVDRVIENEGGADSKPAILSVQPNIIAIGVDWAVKDYYKQMQFTKEWLDSQGITLVYIPHLQVLSSTQIKKRVCG
jgi:glycerol-3-phosphate cytidylyltransferase